MKKILLSAIALLPVLAFAQNTKFTIQGKVGVASAPAKAYLQYRKDGKTVIDSAVLKDGEFTFTGDAGATVPTPAYVLLNEKGSGMNSTRDYKSVYVEPGTINVTGADLVAKAKADGTKANRE
jgi:hypothetical protein